jgi:PIN domain nuclease of toxin-antitoxin system
LLDAVADTHAIIWYLYDDPRLSQIARSIFEQAVNQEHQIGFSAISLIEILYLVERNRIKPDAFSRVLDSLKDPQSVLVEIPIDRDITQAMVEIPSDAIPEMPDRIIAATALYSNAPLISRDHKIALSNIMTIW